MSSENFILLMIGIIFVIIVCIVILIWILHSINSKQRKIENEAKKIDNEVNKQVVKSNVIYTPESILDFMDFEKVEDNMIIQKNGKFLMVVECQGINYDLMSEMEKASVEQGFITFLNTLRHPVQLYIQTRTINLEQSVETYKEKLKVIQNKYHELGNKYDKALNSPETSVKELERIKYELLKQKNLQEYTADIIRDIERQSLNKNILSKKYYVIVPCYKSEMQAGDFNKEEVKSMAFSELYTRSRAVINSLFSCQVTGKILNSEEIMELLYIAYNRDASDQFWLDKIKEAGIGELYSTAPDVFVKKVKLLDKQIEERAVLYANEKIGEARSEKEREALDKEYNQEKYIRETAKKMIEKHRRYIGEEVTNNAIKKISEDNNNSKDKEKEEIGNGVVQEKGKRGRSKKN